MSSSPTLACSRWCSSSRASGARLFSPAWPAARNWSRHWEARAAVIPNSRDTDSRFSPRSRRSTVARLRRAENRPFRSRSAAGLVALRALSAAVDSSTCFLISTRLLRELSRNQVSKKTLGRRTTGLANVAERTTQKAWSHSGTSPALRPVFAPTVLADSRRQPVGTGSAQIRRSIGASVIKCW